MKGLLIGGAVVLGLYLLRPRKPVEEKPAIDEGKQRRIAAGVQASRPRTHFGP